MTAGTRNNFNTIRLAMALLVVWSHSFALHLGSEQTEWISLLLNGAYNAGNLGVMAFFVISGYLITQSFERSSSLKSYLSKRVRRIYPGYLVAVTICAFIIAPLFGGSLPGPSFGLNIFLRNEIPNAFQSNPFPLAVNGSLWSIPFEFYCYLGVAVGGLFLIRRPRILIGLCALVMLGKVVQDIAGKTPSLEPIGTIFGWPYLWTKIAPSFLLGMIFYSCSIPRSRAALIGLIAAAVAACHLNRHVADMLVAPALAYAVFYAAFSKPVPDAAKYGDFSYGTYLYAFPIQQILQATIGKSWSLPTFMFVSAILSVLAGALSWFVVERRFMLSRRRVDTVDVGVGRVRRAEIVVLEEPEVQA